MKLQWQAVPNIDKVWRWSCSKAGDRIQTELAVGGMGMGIGKESIIVLLRTISLDYIDSQTAGHVHSCHVRYGESARVCPLVSHQWSFLSYQETAWKNTNWWL